MKINYREISCSFLFSLITHFNINRFRFFFHVTASLPRFPHNRCVEFSCSFRRISLSLSRSLLFYSAFSAFLRQSADELVNFRCRNAWNDRLAYVNPILRDCIGLHFGNIDGRQAYTCLPVSKTLKFSVNSAYYVTMKIFIESPVNLIWNNDHYL